MVSMIISINFLLVIVSGDIFNAIF